MSRARPNKRDLIAALLAEMRVVSGQGVILSEAVAARLGVSSSDLECLDFVVTRGPLTAGALAQATGLTTGAITGVIDRLEGAGYVRREADADDRRKVVVRHVPAALKRIVPLFEPMDRLASAALERYSEAELALLRDFLERMNAAARAATAELRTLPKATRTRD